MLAALGYVNADGVTGVDDVGGVVHAHSWIRDDRTSIDLHHWLAGAEAPRDEAWEALRARRTWIEVGGRPAAVLDRDGLAVHVALHAAQHGPSSEKQLGELALALERWPAEVWDAAARLAGEIGAADAFAAGLRLLSRGAAEAERLGLPPTGELEWTIRHRRDRPRGTFHARALDEAGSRAERLRILRASVLPSPVWIRQEFDWARGGGLRLAAGYAAHIARTPVWAARAWAFRRRAKRAARQR